MMKLYQNKDWYLIFEQCKSILKSTNKKSPNLLASKNVTPVFRQRRLQESLHSSIRISITFFFFNMMNNISVSAHLSSKNLIMYLKTKMTWVVFGFLILHNIQQLQQTLKSLTYSRTLTTLQLQNTSMDSIILLYPTTLTLSEWTTSTNFNKFGQLQHLTNFDNFHLYFHKANMYILIRQKCNFEEFWYGKSALLIRQMCLFW